jgi:hypothetical protein
MDQKLPGSEAALGGGSPVTLNTGSSIGVETVEQLGVCDVSENKASYTGEREVDNKEMDSDIRYVPNDEESLHVGKGMTAAEKVDNMEEIALYALHVDDDPSLNPWTFRMWFLGVSS